MLSQNTIEFYKLQIEEENERYEKELEEIKKKHEENLKKIQREKFTGMMKETRVANLKRQAFNSYIYGYSKMTKIELVEKVEIRMEEKLLSLQDDLFKKITNEYLYKDESNKLRLVCKTLKKRVKYIKEYEIKNINNFYKKLEECKSAKKINNKIIHLNRYFETYPSMEENKSYIVKIIKLLLDKCSKSNTRKDRTYLALANMEFVVRRKNFLRSHLNFRKTLKAKLEEFERQELGIKKEVLSLKEKLMSYGLSFE